ncbi:apoptosis regulatory protein Siva-like [Ceratina calcarata]|uniref:Apoptosis regulatory protein Siva-like n=1 Tax=Ceratina calcarata TaxID=156304 RepID=A0AAJ7J7H6_9HYME|nr:apoptosis regulatory protein Siva-like [Ceratina calcarata]
MVVSLCQIYSDVSNSLKVKTVHVYFASDEFRSNRKRMPKRPYPFEDNLLPQLKLHVGEKQVNNGVSREELMKDIYGRTMDLLKEGVKTLSQRLNSSMELNAVDVPASERTSASSCKPKTERNSKQMTLTKNLGLLSGDKAIKDLPQRYDLCGCSRVIDQCMLNKCSYCDQVLCNSCLSECATCSDLFCQNCSLPVYEQEEKHKCLNCYK